MSWPRLFAPLLLAGGLACSTPPKSSDAVSDGVDLRLQGPGAERYLDPAAPQVAPPATPVVEAVAQAVGELAAAAGRPAPVRDARLTAMAEDLAASVRAGAVRQELLEFLRSHHGIVEPSPAVVAVRFEGVEAKDAVAAARETLGSALAGAPFQRVGIAAVPRDGRTVVFVVFAESQVQLAPVPRALPAGGVVALRGAVAAPLRAPEVFVTGPDGRVARPETRRTGEPGGFAADVPCPDAPGRLQIGVTASGAGGPTVVAKFPVWCGEAPPRAPTLRSEGPAPAATDATAAAGDLFERLNGARRAAGLPALTRDAALDAVARGHSEDMRDHRFVAHVSPRTGGALDRVKRAQVPVRLVLENVALAESAAEAHEGLMDSPAHRANILNAAAERVGVGAALGRTVAGRAELYVTQVFVQAPEAVEAGSIRGAYARAVEAAGPKRDAPIEAAAQRIAAELAAGRLALDGLQARTQGVLGELHGVKMMRALVRVVTRPVTDDLAREIDGDVTRYGLGVAVGRSGEPPMDAAFVVILLAR